MSRINESCLTHIGMTEEWLDSGDDDDALNMLPPLSPVNIFKSQIGGKGEGARERERGGGRESDSQKSTCY